MYEKKYFKYKSKYMNLRDILFGSGKVIENDTYVLVFGQPGTGKSTICNILTGKDTCKSGYTLYGELTKELQLYDVENDKQKYIFVDIPGGIFEKPEFDVVRDQLAELVRKKFTIFKFMCIVNIDSGRIKLSDKRTIDSIVEHFHVCSSNLLIIANKLSPRMFKELQTSKEKFLDVLSTYLILNVNNFLLLKNNEELSDDDSDKINFNTETIQNIKKQILNKIDLIQEKSLQNYYPFKPFINQIEYYPVLNDTEKIYFSGPISASVGIFNECTYIFFGDQHKSNEGMCDDPCKQMEKCSHYHITDYLNDIFKNNSSKGNYNDFFLEMYYEHKKISTDTINAYTKEIGLIPQLVTNFKKCFQKDSTVSTTRCHNVDLRKMINIEDFLFQDVISIHKQTTDIYDYYDEKNGIVAIFRKFYFFLYYGDYMKDFFDIFISSNNVIDDLINKVKLLLHDIGLNTDINEMKKFLGYLKNEDIFVNRYGGTFHRSGIQLYELRKENKDLAINIQKYLTECYIKKYSHGNITILKYIFAENNINKLIDAWYKLDKTNEYIFDAMLLGRMFRQFKGKNHIDSKLKVVYAGDAHIKTYINFFKSILHVDMFNYKAIQNLTSESRCVVADATKFPKIKNIYTNNN